MSQTAGPTTSPVFAAERGRTVSAAGRGRARFLGAALAVLFLAGCQADELGYGPKDKRPVPRETVQKMQELDMATSSPVLMRIFKQESTFEVWKKDRTGRYALLKSYEICSWSGKLGPKIKEGDRQAPEGYYNITPALMNPNSSYHLAFNTGFPNSFDRAHERTGTHLMVHGACSSRGCYAMSDEQIQEIYSLARDSFGGGQRAFQLQAYPFRMTPENLALHLDDPNMPFWKMLKEGYDHFELTRQEPKVDVCGRRYVFNVTAEAPLNPVAACPALDQPETLRIAAATKAAEDEAKTIEIAARLADEKREAEENAVMLATLEEERLRRAEERRLAMSKRTEVVTAFFSGVTGKDAEPAPMTVGSLPQATIPLEPLPTVSAEGNPLPRPAPREGKSDQAMAMAPEAPPSRSQSIFTRLWSGDEPTAAVAAAPVEAVPAVATSAAPPAQPAVAVSGGADPCAAPEAAADPACRPASAVPAVAAGNASIIDRIGSWF